MPRPAPQRTFLCLAAALLSSNLHAATSPTDDANPPPSGVDPPTVRSEAPVEAPKREQIPSGVVGSAEPPPVGDRGQITPARTPSAKPTSEGDTKFRWRRTWLIWDSALNAQTLGIGKTFQSANPTFEMSGSFRPRYYLYDGKDDAIFAEGRIDLVHEFTNSDVTTKQGETTLSDATLDLGYSRMLALSGEYETLFSVAAPVMTFPTSKFSRDNGTFLGLGGEVRIAQAIPLLGGDAPALKRIILRGAIGYNHTFTRAVVPTNPDLRRVRLDPTGRTVPGDQLTGAAFPEHEGTLSGRVLTDITNDLSLSVEFSYRPTWLYGFHDVDICIATGCVPASRPADPATFVVVNGFQADLFYGIIPELSVALGYVNVATQPGPDGQRRSVFYSPGAQVYLELVGHLDAIYLAGAGHHFDPSDGTHLRP